MKRLILSIIIIIIIILFLVGALVLVNKKSPSEESLVVDKGIIENPESEVEEVSINEFMKIQKCISTYLDYCNKNNSSYYGVDESGNQVKIVKDSYVRGIIYDLLSKKYINENNITINNLYQFVDNIEEKQIYNILDIKKINNTDSNQYIVYGFLQNVENKFLKYKYLIVNLDEINNNFSIEPIFKEYNSIEEISVEDTIIEDNDNNNMPKVNITSESMSKEYFNLFKRIMLSNFEEAYKILDKEYREKRFGDIDSFKNYVQDNKNDILQMTLNQYLVNVYDDYSEYICKDTFSNTYVFNVKKPTKYSVKLDTYTITTEEFSKSYKTANDQNKATMNADKWIKMINARDYVSAYEVLDETFKKNNFESVENFEKYMRKNYSSYYLISNVEYKNEGGIHILKMKIKDIKDNNYYDMNVIIKLNDNLNFVMSFEV